MEYVLNFANNAQEMGNAQYVMKNINIMSEIKKMIMKQLIALKLIPLLDIITYQKMEKNIILNALKIAIYAFMKIRQNAFNVLQLIMSIVQMENVR
jgi:hypothetical protein